MVATKHISDGATEKDVWIGAAFGGWAFSLRVFRVAQRNYLQFGRQRVFSFPDQASIPFRDLILDNCSFEC